MWTSQIAGTIYVCPLTDRRRDAIEGASKCAQSLVQYRGGGYSLSRGAPPGLLNPGFGYDKHAALPLSHLSDASSDIRRAWLTMSVKIFPGN